MESKYTEIGRRIHRLRAEKGISQGKMARLMGLSQTNLSNIEQGKTMVTMKNLFKMQEILGCSMRDFFEDAAEEGNLNMEEITQAMQIMQIIQETKKPENKGEVC